MAVVPGIQNAARLEYRHRLRINFRSLYASPAGVFLESVLIGIVTGLIIVLFRLLLQRADLARAAWYGFLRLAPWPVLALWLVALVPIGLFLGWTVQRWPMIAGSGIPQIRGALLRRLVLTWWPELPMKILASLVGLGCGLSLGREGPSIQIGAYAGKGVLSVLGRPVVERKILISAGAAAGLSAAFNAPLAGVLFALEELHKYFSGRLIACAMGASLAAYMVASRFFGLESVFNFSAIGALGLEYLPAVVGLGAVAALAGLVFKQAYYKAQALYTALPLPAVARPILPLLLSVPVAFWLFDLTGGGHQLIERLSTADFSGGVLLGLLALKIAFSALSYGSGTAGGVFLPLLAGGALLGKFWGVSLAALGWLEPGLELNFMILGMAAFFTAVVKAPITGAILILEMSGNLSHFSGLVACCLAAFVGSDLLRSSSIYEVFLERLLRKPPAAAAVTPGSDGAPDQSTGQSTSSAAGSRPAGGRKLLLEIPVGLGSRLAHRCIRAIDWPAECLVVGIERGETELLPRGGTELEPGDRLLVLAAAEQAVLPHN
ncbi:MAG TPA: hypothetical protein DD477_01545, partial [Spirochaetaceae bacterium]|nr:hypothetical protein [Spirochaetaceae bacterium]HAX38081.1 hypothetical protein [Spirochaetaceae bacterium]HBO39888.1 hypothetical protein [Spirochaetaceae bacterium]